MLALETLVSFPVLSSTSQVYSRLEATNSIVRLTFLKALYYSHYFGCHSKELSKELLVATDSTYPQKALYYRGYPLYDYRLSHIAYKRITVAVQPLLWLHHSKELSKELLVATDSTYPQKVLYSQRLSSI